MRTLFLGSGPFGLPTLDRLAARGGDLVVGTVPDAPKGRKGKLEPTVIKARALEHGLEVHEVASLKGKRGPEFLARVPADLVITCDFRLILGRKFLAAPVRGCFNLHGSILPRYRGAAPVARGVLAGDREFGVTLYRMVYALDAGPVVADIRYSPDIPPDTESLEQILSERAADLLEEWIPVLETGDVPLVPQDDTMATFAPKLEKAEGWVDWTRSANEIECQIRGLRPWPRAFTHWAPANTHSASRSASHSASKMERGKSEPASPDRDSQGNRQGGGEVTRAAATEAAEERVAASGGAGARHAPEPIRLFLDAAIVESAIVESAIVESAIVEVAEPGAIRSADADGIRVACGRGNETLRIVQLQRAGKRSLPAEEFLRGFPCREGSFLPPPPASVTAKERTG